mgnify:FL=1
MSHEKDYTTDYPEEPKGIDLNYRNKTVINQRGATIEITNSTDREELKLSQYSGSNIALNNVVNSELATNNKQLKVQNDSFESVGKDKNTFVGKDKITRVVENTYDLRGYMNDTQIESLSSWNEKMGQSGIPGLNSQFSILRGGYALPPAIDSLTPKIGNRNSNPTLNQRKGVLNNEFSSYCPVPIRSNDEDEVTDYEPVGGGEEEFLIMEPAQSTGPTEMDIRTGSGELGTNAFGVLTYGTYLNAATEGGTWENNEEKNKLAEKLEELQEEELNEIEQKMGNGGDTISFLKRNKFETVGGAVNSFPSVRVDPEGRSQPIEVAVGEETTYTNFDCIPVVEDVNSDSNFPVGSYTLNVGNKYNVVVGSGGVQIKTTGAVEIGGTSVKVAATKLNVMASQGMHLTSENIIELESDKYISLRTKRQQIYIEPGLGIRDNLVVGGGTYVEGELYVNHITAPVEIQQTEDTVALGRFNCKCDRELPIGEVQVGNTWYKVFAYGQGEKAENLIFNYPHSHHFKNIPLRVMDSNKDVRVAAQCEGINFPTPVAAQPQHHERKPVLIHPNMAPSTGGEPAEDRCEVAEKEKDCPEEIYTGEDDICAIIEDYLDPNSSSEASITNPLAGGGSGDYRTQDTSDETRETIPGGDVPLPSSEQLRAQNPLLNNTNLNDEQLQTLLMAERVQEQQRRAQLRNENQGNTNQALLDARRDAHEDINK